MRTAKITCPYCSNLQKIFHLSYSLKKFFNIFSKQEQLIPTRAITDINKQIKKFSCKACLKDLIYFFNTNTKEYFIDGIHLKYARELILKKTNGIDLLKNKIVKLEKVENVPENEKLLEYLRIKVIKEDEELNHLKEEYKDLPLKL
ncbi:MAG: hypothetical protein NTY78_05750 [Pelagibacterales bacterium]|nr:hypothetical protein [Pelagibacterales bacterium]